MLENTIFVMNKVSLLWNDIRWNLQNWKAEQPFLYH